MNGSPKMKRSEMLHIMRDWKLDNTDFITGEQYLDVVDLLDLIEKAGMVPPLLEKECVQTLPNGEITYVDHVHEWEPEDTSGAV